MTTASQEITMSSLRPLVIQPGARKRLPALNEVEARQITQEIQRTSTRLWLLVVEAHDRKAHTALGFETWADYVKAELRMSESRSYQLLDTGHVMRELAAAGADLDAIEVPPARVVARVKDRLPEVRKAARRSIKDGVTVDKALRELAREAKPPADRLTTTTSGKTRPKPTSGRSTMTCPACSGSGKVSRSLGMSVRAFIKRKASASQ